MVQELQIGGTSVLVESEVRLEFSAQCDGLQNSGYQSRVIIMARAPGFWAYKIRPRDNSTDMPAFGGKESRASGAELNRRSSKKASGANLTFETRLRQGCCSNVKFKSSSNAHMAGAPSPLKLVTDRSCQEKQIDGRLLWNFSRPR